MFWFCRMFQKKVKNTLKLTRKIFDKIFWKWWYWHNDSTGNCEPTKGSQLDPLSHTASTWVTLYTLCIRWFTHPPSENVNGNFNFRFKKGQYPTLLILIPLFWTSGDVCPHLCAFHLYAADSSDSPLVWHLLTSWWSVWQPSLFYPCTYTHTLALLGLECRIGCVVQCVQTSCWMSHAHSAHCKHIFKNCRKNKK